MPSNYCQVQGYWGTGYFNEDSEKAPVNLLRSIESKKLLSTAGKFKLLSSADKAGFNLAKVGLGGRVVSAHAGLSQQQISHLRPSHSLRLPRLVEPDGVAKGHATVPPLPFRLCLGGKAEWKGPGSGSCLCIAHSAGAEPCGNLGRFHPCGAGAAMLGACAQRI